MLWERRGLTLLIRFRTWTRGGRYVIVSMFSDNVQYWIKEPLNVLLIMNKEKWLLKEIFMGREIRMFVGRKVITTILDTNENIAKVDRLACVTEMLFSLDELANTDNLEDRSFSDVLLRHQVTGSGEFTYLKSVAPQYKRLRNREFAPLTLRIMDQKDNGITDGPGMAVVLHIM